MHTYAYAYRTCSDLSEGYYTSQGRNYFGAAQDGTSYGQQKYLQGSGSPCDNGGCTAGYTHNTTFCSNPSDTDECGCCFRDYSPIVIDLGNDGLNFSNAADGALSQLAGPGSRMLWVGWPTTTDDAWLVLDRNKNGQVDDGSELFGTATPLASGKTAPNGYEALAEFDSNLDGQIGPEDPIYDDLRLWRDTNRDGLSQPHELTGLHDAGGLVLSLAYRSSVEEDPWGNLFRFWAPVDATEIPYTRWSVDVFPDIRKAQQPSEQQ